MIRFPNRFHASETPGARHFGVEPNYLEERRAHGSPHQVHHVGGAREHRPAFDFTALAAALR